MRHFENMAESKGVKTSEEFVGSKFNELYDATEEYIDELYRKINGRDN